MNAPRPGRARPVDWDEVRRRLARASSALEESGRPSPERARAVLDERARALARVPQAGPRPAEVLTAVPFHLAGERYALEARFVREALPFTGCAPLPGAPELFAGLVNLRGEVLPAFDLRPLLGLGRAPWPDSARVLVLGEDRPDLGLLADSVSEVTALRLDEVHDPPAREGREFVRGLTPDALVVLDAEALLRDPRLFLEHGAAPGA
jgi:purine-binding chemotaxis protein CheW